jgi:hypothetical protein
MSSETVFKHLLDPLVTVYGEPKTDNVRRFLDEYAGLMADFSEDELRCAKTNIMRDHSYRSFPTPAECLKACEKAAKDLSPEWSSKMRERIKDLHSVEELDELWFQEIKPRRARVSKASFETVRARLNHRVHEVNQRGNTDRMVGGA